MEKKLSVRCSVANLFVFAYLALAPAAFGQVVRQPMETTAALFARAVNIVDTGRYKEAEELFGTLIDRLSQHPDILGPDERRMLVSVLSFRARERHQAGSESDAAADLGWLLQLRPNFEFEEKMVSPKLIQLLGTTKQGLDAQVLLKLEKPGKLWVDGRRVDAVGTFYASPGNHVFELENADGRTRINVRSLSNRLVEATFPAATTTTKTVTTGAVNPVEPIVTKPIVKAGRDWWNEPPRRLLVHADRPLGAYTQFFSGTTPFPIYGRTGTLASTYTLAKPSRVNGEEAGFALRLASRFALSVTATRTRRKLDAQVSALVPSPTGTFNRSFNVTAAGLTRDDRALHLGFGVTGGGLKWEVSASAGPSLFSVRQDLVSAVVVQESPGTPFVTAVRTTRSAGRNAIGFHMGADVSWMFVRYLGVGWGMRYSRATVDFPQFGGPASAVVGGATTAMGFRFRI